MCREFASCFSDNLSNTNDLVCINLRFFSRKFRCVFRPFFAQPFNELLKLDGIIWMQILEIIIPVHPIFQITTVVHFFIQNNFGNSHKYSRFTTGICGHPLIRHGCCIRQAWINNNQLGTFHHAFHYPLCMWIKIMTRFQMR